MNTAEADIEQASKASDADFIKEYMCPSGDWEQWTHPSTGVDHTLSLKRVDNLTEAEIEACFQLLEETSGPDYKASMDGWHPDAKKLEMRSPGLRYILVKAKSPDGDGEGQSLQGFASLMPTFEYGQPVIYCYEMQLRPSVQGAGLGQRLMDHVLSTATNVPRVEKTMLTCFVHNRGARRFYERVGFEVDEASPRDRKLRSGKVVTSDYLILSCRAKGSRRKSTEGG